MLVDTKRKKNFGPPPLFHSAWQQPLKTVTSSIFVFLWICSRVCVFISLRQLVFVCFEPWQHSWRDFPLRSKALVSPQNVFVFACPVFLWHSLYVVQDLSYFSQTTTDKSLRDFKKLLHPSLSNSTTEWDWVDPRPLVEQTPKSTCMCCTKTAQMQVVINILAGWGWYTCVDLYISYFHEVLVYFGI